MPPDPSKPAKPTDPRVGAALREYLERVDRGEELSRDDFLLRHAEIADVLRPFIVEDENLRKMAGLEPSRESAGVSTRTFAAHSQETAPPRAEGNRPGKPTESGLEGQFGRYRIIRALGRGGMGAVYLAEDTQLKREVAIKTPRFDDDPSGEVLSRFYREAHLAATLRHANICPVYDVGQIDRKHFISMAYIEGRPLSSFTRPDKLQPERQVQIVIRKLALALQAAHDKGIIHRDLKPANIMVDAASEPIIMDFGLARQTLDESQTHLTLQGDIVGTPAYMSPEQVEGQVATIGPPADQYSLGVILYEMLTGQVPFRGTIPSILGQILTKEPPPPSQLRAGVDPRLEAVCLKMMQKKASDRYPSLRAVAGELTNILKTPASTSVTKRTTSRASIRPDAFDPAGVETGGSRVLKPSEPNATLRMAVSAREDKSATGLALLRPFRRRFGEGGWIAWSVAALALAASAAVCGVILISWGPGQAVIAVDVKDPGVEVAVKGTSVTVTDPGKQSVTVVAGEQELTISSPGLEGTFKRFSLKKGDTRTVTVSIVNRKLEALLEGEVSQPAAGGNQAPPPPTSLEPDPNPADRSKPFGRPFLVRGDWKTEKGELVQTSLGSTFRYKSDLNPVVVFGQKVSNYDFSVDVMKTGGSAAVGVFIHWLGPAHWQTFHLNHNEGIDFSSKAYSRWHRRNPSFWRLKKYDSNRWYTLKVEVRGPAVKAYLDGVLEFEDSDPQFAEGRIALFTDTATARFRRIKVADPAGKIVFEGLPDLVGVDAKIDSEPGRGQIPHSLSPGETAAKSAQEQWARRLKTAVVTTNAIGIKLALIPPGDFQMGSPAAEAPHGHGELRHGVRITAPFYLGLCEVTQAEFKQLLKRNPSWFQNCSPDEAASGPDTSRLPVDSVNWFDAIEFCNKLSELEKLHPYYRLADVKRNAAGSIDDAMVTVEGGTGYRLPSEAQWEYACRAGSTTPFNFGLACNGLECNCDGSRPYGTTERRSPIFTTVRVGSYLPNSFGLFDMHGNLTEWCQDCFSRDYYASSPIDDPTGPSSGADHVGRGGSFYWPAQGSRSAARDAGRPQGRWWYWGFRVARDAVAEARIPRDADRRAAQAVASLGGWATIRFDGSVRKITKQEQLPPQPFELTGLSLDRTKVTDDELALFEGLSKMTEIHLANTHVTDAGLKHLQGLFQLETLHLDGLQITDAGLASLRNLKSLRVLYVANTRITDAGLVHLEEMSELRTLGLFGLRVGDEGLKHLTGLSKLEVLRIRGNHVTDAGLKYLAMLPNLQVLRMSRTRVTNAGLLELKNMKNLRVLELRESNVTPEGVEQLRKLLPKCNISR